MLTTEDLKTMRFAWLNNHIATEDQYKKPWFWGKSTTPRYFVDVRFADLPLYRIPYHHLIDFTIKIAQNKNHGMQWATGSLNLYDETSVFVTALMAYAQTTSGINVSGTPVSIRFGWYDPERQGNPALISEWFAVLIHHTEIDIDRGGGIRFACDFTSNHTAILGAANNMRSRLNFTNAFNTMSSESMAQDIREWLIEELKRNNTSIISPSGPIAYDDIHVVFETEPAPIFDGGDNPGVNLIPGRTLSENLNIIIGILRTNTGNPYTIKSQLIEKDPQLNSTSLISGNKFAIVLSFFSYKDQFDKIYQPSIQSVKNILFNWTFPSPQPEILELSIAKQQMNVAAVFLKVFDKNKSQIGHQKDSVESEQPDIDPLTNTNRETFTVINNMSDSKSQRIAADIRRLLKFSKGVVGSVTLRGEPRLGRMDFLGMPVNVKYNLINSPSYRFHKSDASVQDTIDGLRLGDIENENIAFVAEVAKQLQLNSLWDGVYYIGDVEHTMGSEGFLTKMTIIRELKKD